ncbi:hypothetical protein H5410_023530 [Solanum commersonii]|uniref:Uncharacterized protein n=1 Tax=Solanum commersonii TaxID=4109 RepID=A0A9J5ZH44_SOLCO|nr:hypothetical protein H5410_023530 [Solanum commersonii]
MTAYCYTLLSVRDEVIDLEVVPDSYVPPKKEAVEQEIKRRKKEVSQATSPLGNGLYDSSFWRQRFAWILTCVCLRRIQAFLKLKGSLKVVTRAKRWLTRAIKENYVEVGAILS